MLSCDHVIAGVTKGGLRVILFFPRNSLRASMHPFSKTVVSIAYHLHFFNFMHLQSLQCDGTIDLMILTILLNGQIRSDSLFHRNKSMVKFDPYTHPHIVQSDD
jgi:hypothetical protein